MSRVAEDIILSVSQVASLPQVFMKVEEVLDDPDSSSADLARVIEEDPSLTARLLRLVNSPFYGFVAKVETVNSAITVMGTQQLRELVLACSVLRAFEGVSSELLNMELFWRHSIACGSVARLLATLRGESNVERFLVAGLLHDIGRLVLLMERPRQFAEVLAAGQEAETPLFELEQDAFGFDHALLGSLLLKHWKLSPRLIEAVQFHHAPGQSRNFSIDTAIVHFSDVVTHALALGASGSRFVPRLDAGAWQSLALPEDKLNHVLGALDEQYAAAVRFILGD
jgi:putative nucleotidyltransferase with HDIG domain